MAKGTSCIIYRPKDKVYLKFDSMADAGRYLGVDPKHMRSAVRYDYYIKDWKATTDIPEFWFIDKGFEETVKIEGGWANARVVRVVPNDEAIVPSSQKNLDKFLKILGQE